jgi:nucleoside-diphosphate-sugar epimerase
VRTLRGDRRRLADHSHELRLFAPEVVVDMVPMNESDARGLVEVFRGVAERVVAIGSQDVYRAYDVMRGLAPGPPDPVPLSEEAPLRDRLYPYEREGVEEYEKILVERAILADPHLPGTVLRLPMVYGPGDYMRRLYPYVKRVDDGRSAVPIGERLAGWRWSGGYVEDVAAAIVLAATDDRAAGRVYNVGEAEALPWAEWARAVVRAAGGTGEVVVVPDELLPTHLGLDLNAEQDLLTDTSRIRRELGYREEVPREEALRRTVEWERANPPEKMDPEAFDYAAEDAALEALNR